FDDRAAALLADQDGLRGLRRLTLDNTRLTGPGARALGGLRLRLLHLETAGFALGGLAALASSAAGEALEELRLANLPQQPPGRVPAIPRLRRLGLLHSGLEAEHLTALAADGLLAGVTDLDLTGNRFGPEGVSALADSGAAPRSLRLAACDLGAEGVRRVGGWRGLSRVALTDLEVKRLAAQPDPQRGDSPQAPDEVVQHSTHTTRQSAA